MSHQDQIKDTVAAILVKEGKFLVEKRRSDDDSDPGFIAIPGGHVEAGESFHDALKREMMEELGITIMENPVNVCIEYHTTTSGERNRAHYYRIDKWDGIIVSNEAESVYWESDPEKLTAPADKNAVSRVF